MIDKKFFLKRDIFLYFLIVTFFLFVFFINFILNFPKMNQKQIEYYKKKYDSLVIKEKKMQKEFSKNQKKYRLYKAYFFTKREIIKIKKILDIFSSLLAKFQVAQCRVTDYFYDKNYINVLQLKVICNNDIDALKYITVFKFFFTDLQKHNVIKIKQIERMNNEIIFSFFKSVKGN